MCLAEESLDLDVVFSFLDGGSEELFGTGADKVPGSDKDPEGAADLTEGVQTRDSVSLTH